MAQIVLDAEAFKALSSDTRLQILKALDARRLTVSEMGRLLELNKATVFEHLKQLMTADLVKKEDEGRKWVYYRLTWKGKNVLHPENVQFMLLLATSIFSIGGLVAQIGRLLSWWGPASPVVSMDGPAFGPVAGAPADPDASGESGGSGGAGAGTASNDRFTMGDTASSPPESKAAGHDGGFWTGPNLWLLATLLLLLIATAIFAWRYWSQRRKERAPLLAKIKTLPTPEPDAVQA